MTNFRAIKISRGTTINLQIVLNIYVLFYMLSAKNY